MKKLSFLLAALAIVLGLSQCRKPNLPALNGGETQHVVLNASWDNGGSKIEQDGIGLKWKEDDKLVVKHGETPIGTLECKDVEAGIFEGGITKPTGKITFTFQSENYRSDFLNQTGALNDAVCLTSAEYEYAEGGDYGTVLMTMSHAVLKLDLSYFATTSKSDVTVTITKQAADKTVEQPIIASVTGVTKGSKEVYVAIPVGSDAKVVKETYVFTGNSKTVEKEWPPLVQNKFYTKDDGHGQGTGEAIVIGSAAPTTPKFSVSADTKVEFAPGNLYYDGGAFHFEANQWSFANTWSTNHVSHFKWSDATNAVTSDNSYSGDLFCANGFTVTGDSHTDWRTLSMLEWNYLLGMGSTYRNDAENLNAWVVIEGVNGLVILPDGSTATASEITTSSDLADAGAVFLPAAGGRLGTITYDVGSKGYYLSSTPYGTDKKDIMFFGSNFTNGRCDDRIAPYSVRLVR